MYKLTISSFDTFLDSLLDKDIEYSFKLFLEEFILSVVLEKNNKNNASNMQKYLKIILTQFIHAVFKFFNPRKKGLFVLFSGFKLVE